MVQLNKCRLGLKLLYFQRVDLWTQKIKNVIREVQWTERKRTKDTKLPHVQLQSIMQGLLIWFSVQVIFSNWGKIFFGGKLNSILFTKFLCKTAAHVYRHAEIWSVLHNTCIGILEETMWPVWWISLKQHHKLW